MEPLVDQAATKAGILDQLGTFVAQVRNDPTRLKMAVVHLGGHGKAVDNRFFVFMPYDYVEERSSTHLYWDGLKPLLEQLNCPVLVLLDSCHSGLAARGRDEPEEYLRDFPTQRGVMVLAASQPEEQAQEGKFGLLTQAVVEVLTGSAEKVPGDGAVVTLQDLAEYACRRVGKLARAGNKRQSPLLRADPRIFPGTIPIALRSHAKGG